MRGKTQKLLLLSLVMILSLIAFGSRAQAATLSGKCGENLSWQLNESTGVMKITGSGEMSWEGGTPWEEYKDKIKTITADAGVTSVAGFYGCQNLTSVNMPGVTSADDMAFSRCVKLTTVTLPKLTRIGYSSFAYCTALENADFPKVTTLQYYSFSGCSNLKSISFPLMKSMQGGYTFSGCSNLQSINLPLAEAVPISTFSNCTSLQSVSLPKVESVDYYAFSSCTSLTSISMPKLTTLKYAFSGCSSLESLDLPAGLTTLEGNFTGCENLKSIHVQSGNSQFVSVDGVLFSKDKSTLIAYPAGKTSASYAAPGATKTIHPSAFSGNKHLSTVALPGVTNLGRSAFSNCVNLIQFSAPLAETAGNYAFNGCLKLTTVSLPKMKTAGAYVFQGCGALRTIQLPYVTEIGWAVFQDCTALTKADLPLLTSWDGNCFENCTSLVQVNLPKVQTISYGAFRNCVNLTSFPIPSGVTRIEGAAFFGCKRLESVTIPARVTQIDDQAFAHCSKLKNLTLPANLTSLGMMAFANCYAVTSLKLPAKLETIGDGCFQGTGLTNVTIPASVTEIGNDAFFNCDKLSGIIVDSRNQNYTSLYGTLFNKDKTTLLAYAAGKDAVSYSIPGTVSHVVYSAFYGSQNLKQLHVPGSVQGLIFNSWRDEYYECEPLNKGKSALEDVFFFGDKNFDLARPLKAITGFGIRTQPTAVSVKAGEAAQFSVATVGQDLSYQWQYKGPKAASWTDSTASGAKTATMKINNTKGSSNGLLYRCLVTLPSGKQMTSHYAVLTVTGEPVFTMQPKNTSVTVGNKYELKAAANGNGLTYVWYYKAEGGSTFIRSSITGAVYSNTARMAANGMQFYCVATDSSGATAKSETVTLTVKDNLTITAQPKNTTANEGQKYELKVAAAGTGVTYTWYYKAKGADAFTKSSITSATYSNAAKAAVDGMQFYCLVRSSNGGSLRSDTVTLTVKPVVPVITVQPKNTTVNTGQRYSLSVTASGTGLTYTWYYKAKGAGSFTKSSITSSTYGNTAKTAVDGMQFYCEVKNSSGAVTRSDTITLTVKSGGPVISVQPQNTTATAGQRYSLSVTAGGTGLRYTWYYKAASASGFTKSTVTSATYTNTAKAAVNGMQFYCVITDANGNSVETDTVTLNVK